jgi:chromate transporter
MVMGIFAKIGTTSFGGGSATIAAIRQACIRHGWMSEQQFIEIVVLSRLTPGISILAQTLLIGRAVAGIAGMFAALIGLLTPSLIITVALAKLYQVINTLPSTATPLHAIVATAAGFAVAMTLQLSRDVFRDRRVRATAIILIIYIALAFLIVNPLYVMGISIVPRFSLNWNRPAPNSRQIWASHDFTTPFFHGTDRQFYRFWRAKFIARAARPVAKRWFAGRQPAFAFAGHW